MTTTHWMVPCPAAPADDNGFRAHHYRRDVVGADHYADVKRERDRALEALRGIYDLLPRPSCASDAPDGCPVCVARKLLEGR